MGLVLRYYDIVVKQLAISYYDDQEVMMGFKEDLEKDREQKEQQRREWAYYKKLCQELPYINDEQYKGDRPYDFYEKWYKNSLKVNLSQEQQKIIDEAIEFLEGWKMLPTEIDVDKVSVNISKADKYVRFSDNECWHVSIGYSFPPLGLFPNSFQVKHRWSDGSIHNTICGLGYTENCCIHLNDLGWIYSTSLGKMFRASKIRRIAQEMKDSYIQKLQKKLDMYWNNYLDGFQEYVWLCYYEDSEYHKYKGLTIFRDGTVFDSNSQSSDCPLNGNLYEFLLCKMKKGKDFYDWH